MMINGDGDGPSGPDPHPPV